MYVYIYIYIYIYMCVYVCIYIYIYMRTFVEAIGLALQWVADGNKRSIVVVGAKCYTPELTRHTCLNNY